MKNFAEFLYREPAVAALLMILAIGSAGAAFEALSALFGVAQ
jgi:hypothetical protein